MDETKIEKLARLSGRVAWKVVGALERRGYDLRGKTSTPISRVPRRAPPPKPKSNGWTPVGLVMATLSQPCSLAAWRAREIKSISNTHTEIPDRREPAAGAWGRLRTAGPGLSGGRGKPSTQNTMSAKKIRRAIWDLHIDSADPLTSFAVPLAW